MHLRNYPQYFTKDGKRRAVYYTADAAALKALGWQQEGLPEEPKAKPVKERVKESKPEPEKIEAEVVSEEPVDTDKLPDFEFMTKNELLKFAADQGETLQSTSLKSELVEACKKLVRARNELGRFQGDDPSTPDVNEAWTIG